MCLYIMKDSCSCRQDKRGGLKKCELPEFKDISDKYRKEGKRLEEYRAICKAEALDMLKKYFYALWD